MPITRRNFIKQVGIVAAIPNFDIFGAEAASDARLNDNNQLPRLSIPTAVVPRKFCFPHSFLDIKCPAKIPEELRPDRGVEIFRPQDMLWLKMKWQGFELRPVFLNHLRYHRLFKTGANARWFVIFPPQHIAEENVDEGAQLDLPAKSSIAGPSKLVFGVPPDFEEPGIGFSIDLLLNWDWAKLIVNDRALPPLDIESLLSERERLLGKAKKATPNVAPPAEDETSIEFPYGIFISPHEYVHWKHKSKPKQLKDGSDRPIELWNTSLELPQPATSHKNNANPTPATVRALYSDSAKIINLPWVTSPNDNDARQIVDLSSNYGLGDGKYVPKPISAPSFRLSSIGAQVKLKGLWNQPDKVEHLPPTNLPGLVHHHNRVSAIFTSIRSRIEEVVLRRNN